jgi:predicted enzyme related to lactoylglutathione lyase
MDRVCHFEVPYSEKTRMEKFYGSVFGWQFHDTPGEMPYTFAITTEVDEQFMPTKPGGINGGSYPRGDEGAASPVIVIEVNNCEQRIRDVQQAGGQHILGPHEVSGMGIYGQVRDTEGNIIGLWQPLHGEA